MNHPKFLLYLGFLVLGAGIVWAGSTSLTTYYPAPTGNYNQITSNYVSIGTTTTNQPLIVMNGGVGIGTAAPAGALEVEGGNVGIGTATFTFGTTPLSVAIAGAKDMTNTNSGAGNMPGIIDTAPMTIGVGGALNFFGKYNGGGTITLAGVIDTAKANATTNNYSFDTRFLTRRTGTVAALERVRILGLSGNVGIGTTNPRNLLDVYGGVGIGTDYAGVSSAPVSGMIVEGNVGIGTTLLTYNTVLLEAAVAGAKDMTNTAQGASQQLGLVDTTPMTQGVGGALNFFGHHTTAGGWVLTGVIDSTKLDATSGSYNFDMRFLTRKTGVASVTERMRILGISGNVGIGETTPVNLLDVSGNVGIGAGYSGVSSAPANGMIVQGNVGIGTTSPSALLEVGARKFDVLSGGNVGIGTTNPTQALYVVGNIYATGTVSVPSDRRLKQNIAPLSGTLSKLDHLRGVSFEWNRLAASLRHKEGEKGIGMIAQELQKIYPELVLGTKNEYLSIDYGKFTAVLLQSVKELKNQMKAMQDQINDLQRKVKTLEKQK